MLEEITRLKKKVTRMERDAAKAQGALDNTMEQIQNEFGCSSLEEAEKKLRKLREQEKAGREELERELQAFKERWGL